MVVIDLVCGSGYGYGSAEGSKKKRKEEIGAADVPMHIRGKQGREGGEIVVVSEGAVVVC